MEHVHIGRKEAAYIITIVSAILFLFLGNHVATRGEKVFGRSANTESVPAKIDLILARESQPFQLDERDYQHVTVYFEATFTQGSRRGQQISGEQFNDPLMALQMKEVEEGDRVMLCYIDRNDGTGSKVWTMQEYDRSRPLIVLTTVFLLLICLFGGRKGIGTMVALVLTCLAIFFVFVPSILSGRNIILWTWITCLYIIVVTLILVNGFSVKSLAAGIGCMGGLIFSGALFRFMDLFLKLTGLIDEDSVYLLMLENTALINLKSIIYSSILIGVLGAALDVSVSIAAAIGEVRRSTGSMGIREMMESGMNVGRDILGTMANTLILVYIGSTLSLTLLLVVYSNSFMELINREAIVIEVLQALIGTIGLVLIIPLTAFSYAFLANRRGNREWD